MAGQFRVKNWAKFQHYKHRCPPWIKLHVDIFSSEDWVMLDDASKLLAVACMVIASKHNGIVPDSPDYIQRVAYLNKRPNLKPLIDCGFIENTLADASKSKRMRTNADTEQSRAETEEESIVAAATPPPPKQKSKKSTRASMPIGFPAQKDLEWSEAYWLKHGRSDLCQTAKEEIEKFRDHHNGKLTASADWPGSWRTWARNAIKFNNGGHNGRKQSAHEKFFDGAAQFIRDLEDRHDECETNNDSTLEISRPLLSS